MELDNYKKESVLDHLLKRRKELTEELAFLDSTISSIRKAIAKGLI